MIIKIHNGTYILSDAQTEDNGGGARRETNLADHETKSKLGANEPSTATVTGTAHEPHKKKSLFKKIKDKLSGHHNDP